MESIGESDLVQYLQRRWMDRVAAKVAIEVVMRFEQRNADPGSRQQE
jgi:hypothetical protein